MTINKNFNTISLKYFVSKIGVLEDAKTLHSIRNIYKNTKSYRDEIIIHDINGNQIKEHRNFYEIFIDGKPLSFILDDYYENTTPIVYNWVGLLGAFNKKQMQLLLNYF